MKKPINIRIDPKLLEKIRAKAKEQKRTVTNLVEYVMERYCDEL
jgi:predicted HicB family RNase H-like nuclease